MTLRELENHSAYISDMCFRRFSYVLNVVPIKKLSLMVLATELNHLVQLNYNIPGLPLTINIPLCTKNLLLIIIFFIIVIDR